MAQLIAPSDFDGFFALAKSTFKTPVLQDYIDRYHDITIRKLLGKDLGNLFIADIPAFPTPRLATLNNPFTEQDNTLIRESRGVKDLLLAVVFYYYHFDQQNQSSQSGVAKRDVEAGIVNSPENAARFAEKKWNDMIETWENIQWYCKTFDPAIYPDFKGEPTTPRWSAVL
jgi:hypothetical protein